MLAGPRAILSEQHNRGPGVAVTWEAAALLSKQGKVLLPLGTAAVPQASRARPSHTKPLCTYPRMEKGLAQLGRQGKSR